MGHERTFNVVVEEVHSGDDLVLMVDLGMDGLHKRVRARLKGVDTPSAFRAKQDTAAGTIRDTIRGMIVGAPCSILLHSHGKGGWVVTLFRESAHMGPAGAVNINELLVKQGYVYTPQGRPANE
jgi:hypothetical protein